LINYVEAQTKCSHYTTCIKLIFFDGSNLVGHKILKVSF
jgi:hypothetical protein